MPVSRKKAQVRLMTALWDIEDDGDGRDEAIACILEGLLKHVPVDVIEKTSTMVEDDNAARDCDGGDESDEEDF